jgi:hypothetical protein
MMLALYVGLLTFAVVVLATKMQTLVNMKHLAISTAVGLVVTFMPLFIRKVMKIEVSLSIVIFAYLMIFLNTLGEVFELYYKFKNWDLVLHSFGGYGYAFICFGAFYSVRAPHGRLQTTIYLLGAIAVSISISAVWEVMEFTADTLFGTNMQKVIPENELFNGGSTKAALNGTDEQIVRFFRNPSGYMYAVMDTMIDLVCSIAGAVIFPFVYLINRRSLQYKEAFIKVEKVDKRSVTN